MTTQQKMDPSDPQIAATPLAGALPDFDFATRHERLAAASLALVWEALHRVRFANMRNARPRLKNGSMPCDGASLPAQIDAFRRWVHTERAA